ncbi:MAG: glucans biosynthesis glucosyltransferase MdoH [Alphaproteobacteria bacterium]
MNNNGTPSLTSDPSRRESEARHARKPTRAHGGTQPLTGMPSATMRGGTGPAAGHGRLSQQNIFALRDNKFRCDAQKDLHFSSMPAMRRLSMTPAPIDRNPFARAARRLHGQLQLRHFSDKIQTRDASSSGLQAHAVNWRVAAHRRRLVLITLVAVQTAIASWSLTYTFPYPWLNGFEFAIISVFAVLFSWISFGFWSALVGFLMHWKGRSRFSIDESALGFDEQQPLNCRTAVLMPICNEDVDRVFAGVEATYRSLAATRHLAHFDFFILSDTSDSEQQVEEEMAWAELCRKLQGFGRIFYRHRRINIKRKSGNIADFLRRWGRNYEYMVVLDADSIMPGETLVRLVRIMERCPKAGIVQTVPTTVNRESLYARLQQFASRVYGPMLAAGLRFWQLGESYYWGHNAILRIEPFIRYCGLGRLPGRPPLGGEILSHDFVEAALMGRAGWEVWIVNDSSGSYEETPTSLLDEFKRDRRWCQGNLQHLKLIFTDGLRGGHLAIFTMGVMAYASALLWLVFLLLSSIEATAQAVFPPVYFSSQPSLFPIWPQWRPGWAIALVSTTALLLFLPKFFSFLLIVKNRETRLFGGFIHLCFDIFLETIISSLLAPVRMWYQSKFVVLTLLGRQIKWNSQQRGDNQLGWLEAMRAHGTATIVAALWIATMWQFDPYFLWWLLPVATPLLLSVPLSVYSSRVSIGRRLRKWRLLLIPEEIQAPDILKNFQRSLTRRRCHGNTLSGFERAALDRMANAVHVALLRGKTTKWPEARARNLNLVRKALAEGPASLSRSDKAYLLRDAEAMARLYEQARKASIDVQDKNGFAAARKWYVENYPSLPEAMA